MYTPDSVIYLCNVPLEADQKNQLHFGSVSEQTNYFESTVVKELTGFTFVRRDSAIRCPENIEDLYNCNYVMYQNSHFTDKWFYAFITELEYLNDAVTAIHIKTDVFQTWMFETEILPSFVVREHTNNDTIGANTFPENVELGPYVAYSSTKISLTENTGANPGCDIVIAYVDTDNGGAMYNGVFTGLTYLTVHANEAGVNQLNEIISKLTESNQLDRIAGMWQVPAWIIHTGSQNIGISKGVASLDGYAPRNNKLYTYPYCYMGISNHCGDEAKYQFELFGGTECTFTMRGAVSNNTKVILTPTNYKNFDYDIEDSITMGNFPQCTWISDSYAQYVGANYYRKNAYELQLATTIPISSIGSAVNMAANGNIGAAFNSVVNYGETVHSYIAKQLDYANMAPNIHNLNGDETLNINLDIVEFEAKKYTIRKEYARVIDDYFSMFGYATNRVKTPNIGTRQNWNYVQTIDIQITGAIPNDDMSELRDIYNSGVTIWNNPDTFGDYSQNNDIVS